MKKMNTFKEKAYGTQPFGKPKNQKRGLVSLNKGAFLLCLVLFSIFLLNPIMVNGQTVTKSALPTSGTTVNSCDVITYIVNIDNNTGGTIAGQAITDAIPTGTVYIAGSLSVGATSDSKTVPTTISDAGGISVSGFELLDTETITVSFQVQVVDPYPTGGPASIQNTATYNGVNSNTTDHPVDAMPVLMVTKSAIPANGSNVCPGSTIIYFVEVENTGTSTAENVTIDDDISANTTMVENSVNISSTNYLNGTCSINTGQMTDDTEVNVTVGNIPPGGVAIVTFEVTVNIPLADGTAISNDAIVSLDNFPDVTSNAVNHTVNNAGCCPPIAECDFTENIVYLSTTQAGATTGVINDPTRPFPTWGAAVSAANGVGNTTIYFQPATYSHLTDQGAVDVATISNSCILVEGNNQLITNGGTSVKFAIVTGCNVVIQNLSWSGFNQIDGSVLLINSPNFICNNCEFNASEQGNPVEIGSGVATFNNSLFANNPINAETFSSGAMDITGGIVNLNDTDFMCNRRNGFGGAIDQTGGTLNISGGVFSGNLGSGGSGDGGAINTEGNSILDIDGTTFTCNWAEASVGDAGGGAIRIQSGPTVTIDNAIFSGNTASDIVPNIAAGGYGGAINISTSGAATTLNLSNSSFTGNRAARGGAMYIENGSTVSIDNCYFEDNEAHKEAFSNGGGAIFSETTYTLSNSTITGNWTFDDNGGGLEGGTVNLSNSVICGNFEDNDGGTPNDTGGAGINDLGGNDVGTEGIGNCAAPANGASNTVPTAPIACAACPGPPAVGPPIILPEVCEANSGNILLNCNCTFLCSQGDDAETGANPTLMAGQSVDFDIIGYTAPSGAASADYEYQMIITDNVGLIVDVITIDPLTTQSHDLTNYTNNYTPGEYLIFTYHYLSTEPDVTVPVVNGSIENLNETNCADLSNQSDLITVLDPVTITVNTLDPLDPFCSVNGVDAGLGRFFTEVIVNGGYPAYATANGLKETLYDITIDGVVAQTSAGVASYHLVDYVDGNTVAVEVTGDNNPASCMECSTAGQAAVEAPHQSCAACPDIVDGSLAIDGGISTVCDGDMVTVCVDVDLAGDPTAIVEFSNDGFATFMDGTPNAAAPPTQFCFTFTETNATCDPIILSYQARFRAASLADPLCDVDLQTMDNNAMPVTATVFPDLNDLVASDDITLVGNNTCGPSIVQNCGFLVLNTFDANGANPDFSTTMVDGQVLFTILQPGAPAGCANIDIPANFACLPSNPAITIDKDDSTPGTVDTDGDDTQAVNPDGTATFTITVTNTGDVDLENVEVADPLSPDCGRVIGDVAAGEIVTYVCTLDNVDAALTNIATVTGDPVGGGNPVEDMDESPVTLNAPSITIDKDDSTPGTVDTDGDDTQAVNPDGTATFTITVTNTGDVDLENVEVADPLSPDCGRVIGDVAAGEIVTYVCTLDNVDAALTNIATVTGDPVGGGNPVEDMDESPVTLNAPSITIDKDDSTPGTVDTDGDDTQAVNPDGTATFTITVTNTGDVDLENVEVADPLSPDCGRVIGDVAAGEIVTYVCTLDNVDAALTNIATVTGDPVGGGNPVEDMDESPVTLNAPSITIDKDDSTPGTVDTDGDDTQAVNPDGTATFTITVTNTGDVDLENVEVADPLSPDCGRVIGDVAAGEIVTYVCTLDNVDAALTNIATVTGDPVGGGNPVEDMDESPVTLNAPSITIDKDDSTPGTVDTDGDDTQAVNPDGTATFTITVTNTGDVDLENVEVADPLSPDCGRVIGDVAAGEIVTYVCTLDNVDAALTNIATVTGDPVGGGNPVEDMDESPVTLNAPSITIDKDDSTPGTVDTDGDDTQAVNPDGTATFTITVTNTGDVDLENVEVADPLSPDCDRVIGDVAAGEIVTYVCTLDNVDAALTNIATVTGDPVGGGNPVEDMDESPVTLNAPSITIDKDDSTPGTVDTDGDDTQAVNPDGTATFTITVTNTGDVDLENVEVADPLSPDCDRVIGDVAAGEIVTYVCTLDNVDAALTNIATVTGDPVGGGNPVEDMDESPVTLNAPSITIDKDDSTPGTVDTDGDDTQAVNPDGTATFTITVTNTGDVDLENVEVADPLSPDCDRVIGDVAAGEIVTYVCTLDNVDAALTNIATVTGDPVGGGNPVEDMDETDVVVPLLLAEKTSTFVDANNNNQLNPGEQVDYTIVIANSGTGDALDVLFSDAIPTGTTYVDGTLMTSQGTMDDSADPLTADIGTIPANGGMVTLTFSVTIDNPFPNVSGMIENQGFFTSSNHPEVPTDDPEAPINQPMNPGDPGDPTVNPVDDNIIVIVDPCNCLENESAAGDDGQFMEIITFMGPANQNWVIQSVDGLFQPNSPAPPAAPIPFPANFAITEIVPGTYVLEGVHVDAIGFTATLTNGINTISVPDVGRNTCFYPNGVLAGLNASFCADDMAIVDVNAVLDNNPAGTVLNFEIIGTTDFTTNGNTLSFVPADLAPGNYTVRFEFDAEDATINDPSDPGCMIVLEESFVIDEPIQILCRPPVNTISDSDICGLADHLLLPPLVLNGGTGPFSVNNNAPLVFPLGTTLVTWTVTDANGCPATCEQNVTVNDNLPPTISCPSSFQAYTSWTNCGYPATLLGTPTVSDNCGVASVVSDAPSFFPPGDYMVNWTATDVNGNQAMCMQWVKVFDTTLPKLVTCPADVSVVATSANGATATWDSPTGMDNCPGDLIWLSTHNSGDFFPLGTTDVVYTLYDQNGNFVNCEFSVSVNPAGDPNVAIAGLIATEAVETMQDVEVYINGSDGMSSMLMTVEDGLYDFSVPMDGDYSVSPQKNINLLNGVSTYDMVLINKHILNVQTLDSPFKLIAADVNRSGGVSTLDLVHLQKAILLINDEFPNNTSWRFINKSVEFTNPSNPFAQDIPEVISYNNLIEPAMNADFVAVKIGDVNGNASPNSLLGADDRTETGTLTFNTKNQQLKAGESYSVALTASDFYHTGFQFTLNFATEKLAFDNLESDLLQSSNVGLTMLDNGAILVSWHEATLQKWVANTPILQLNFTALGDADLSEVLSINSQYLKAEAYGENEELQTVDLTFDKKATSAFQLYQNVPNPFGTTTMIGFDLPKATATTFTITDLSGRVVYESTANFDAGYHQIEIDAKDLPSNGVWYYQLATETDFASGKMIIVR